MAGDTAGSLAAFGIRTVIVLLSLYTAYNIRLFAVKNYGKVIHEFDPWFNYRATEYLVDNGWEKFSTWYDDKSWYPLGRPVGTTIYPGLQLTASFLYYTLKDFGLDIPLNDVCVFIPAVFACVTCIFTGLITYETTRSASAAVGSLAIMSIIPSHLMRSVAGGFDNESVAVAAICATFYFYIRSLRNSSSWPWGIITGFSYIYMVAAWGGYVFVLNMIGVHAGISFLIGRFDSNLHRAYSLFYIIGTAGAIQFPVVGLAPLKSLEQLGPAGIFVLFQLLEISSFVKKNIMTSASLNTVRFQVFAAAGALLAVFVAFLMPEGYLGPVSARVRGLFVEHTRTGNPLVDSVAEHQATRPEMYVQYFHFAVVLGPIGLLTLFVKRTNAQVFLILYTLISMYFSRKMVRLVLILAPAASICSGIAIGYLLEWSATQLSSPPPAVEETAAPSKKDKKGKGKGTKAPTSMSQLRTISDVVSWWKTQHQLHRMIAFVVAPLLVLMYYRFYAHCNTMAEHLSNPSIMIKGRTRSGEDIMIDDFRESYWWLRDNTPEDSRVLAWWDYGYQINGIANRTTIADGNTWNHEHIALLGRILVSPEKDAWNIARHLSDYVLVWSTRFGGMYGDDMAKSPHMARISGSVYSEINPNLFGMDQNGQPSPMMRASLIYNLHGYRFVPDIPKPKYFEEVHTSKNNMVRIYKVLDISDESKEYCKTHHNYPPALNHILEKKKDFEQLEDFNRRNKQGK